MHKYFDKYFSKFRKFLNAQQDLITMIEKWSVDRQIPSNQSFRSLQFHLSWVIDSKTLYRRV